MSLDVPTISSLLEKTLSNSQEQITEASESILVHRKNDDFLAVAFQVVNTTTLKPAVRSAAAIQFNAQLTESVSRLDLNLLVNMSYSICQTCVQAAGESILTITRQFVHSFNTIFEFISLSSPTLSDSFNLTTYIQEAYAFILNLVDNSSVNKTDACIQLITALLSNIVLDTFKDVHLQITQDFYDKCLRQLLLYLCSLKENINAYVSPVFIENCFKCLRAFFVFSASIIRANTYDGILSIICELIVCIGIGQNSIEIRNAKDYALQILLYYANQARFCSSAYSLADSSEFLTLWVDSQEKIAHLLIAEFSICPQYDLWEDHASLESLFKLSCKILEMPQASPLITSVLHQRLSEASVKILAYANDIIGALLQMLYNAAILRIEKFASNDLLVIDCLKPCLDFIALLCRRDKAIFDFINGEMHSRMDKFLTGDPDADLGFLAEEAGQAQAFIGIILLRRGIENAPLSYKGIVIFSALKNHHRLHPILFEEVAKLIISVTTDDNDSIDLYVECPRPYVGPDAAGDPQRLQAGAHENLLQAVFDGTNTALALQAAGEAVSERTDFVPSLVYALGCMYLLDGTSFFESRMITGILARCVRSDMISLDKQRRLLAKSLNLIAGAEDSMSAGGMITFCRVTLPSLDNDSVESVLEEFLTSSVASMVHDLLRDPRLVAQGRKLAEMIAETICLVLTNSEAFSASLESKLAGYVASLLAIDMKISGTLFAVFNSIVSKPLVTNGYYTAPYEGGKHILDRTYGIELFLPTIELLRDTVDKFNADPRPFVYAGGSVIEDAVCESLTYIMYVLPRYTDFSPIMSYVSSLFAARNNAVFLIAGSFILTKVMNVLPNRRDDPKSMAVLPAIFDMVAGVVNGLSALCGSLLTHNLTSDLKRLLLVSIALLFLTFLARTQGLLAATEGAQYDPCAVKILAFIASWMMQDSSGSGNGEAVFFTLRQWVAMSVAVASKYLVGVLDAEASTAGAKAAGGNIIVPLLVIAYFQIHYVSRGSSALPMCDFNNICSAGVPMAMLEAVMMNINSQYTRFSTIVSGNLLPMWEGFLSTCYGHFLRQFSGDTLGEFHAEQFIGRASYQSAVVQAISSISLSTVEAPNEFREYMDAEFSAVNGTSLLSSSLMNMNLN